MMEPRSNVLDDLDPNGAERMASCAPDREEWVRTNHVRTIAPLVAAGLLRSRLFRGDRETSAA